MPVLRQSGNTKPSVYAFDTHKKAIYFPLFDVAWYLFNIYFISCSCGIIAFNFSPFFSIAVLMCEAANMVKRNCGRRHCGSVRGPISVRSHSRLNWKWKTSNYLTKECIGAGSISRIHQRGIWKSTWQLSVSRIIDGIQCFFYCVVGEFN